jgi:hypothetical protein
LVQWNSSKSQPSTRVPRSGNVEASCIVLVVIAALVAPMGVVTPKLRATPLGIQVLAAQLIECLHDAFVPPRCGLAGRTAGDGSVPGGIGDASGQATSLPARRAGAAGGGGGAFGSRLVESRTG